MSPETTYELIKEVFLLLDDGDRQLLSKFGLTVPRYHALLHLGNSPGLSPNSLSDLMFCDKSNITRLIRGMELEGLVSRQRHESDGRSVRLFLTDEGHGIRTQAMQAHEEYTVSRFDGDVMTEVSHLQELLQQLKRNLADKLEHVNDFT